MKNFMLLNGTDIKIYQDLSEIKHYSHQGWNFHWLTLEPCLSQHNQQFIHNIDHQPNQETVYWIVDGIVEIDLGFNNNRKLTQGEVMILTGHHSQQYHLKTRSAWSAQILIINRPNNEVTEMTKSNEVTEVNNVNEGTKSNLTNSASTKNSIQFINTSASRPVGDYGIWRSFSKAVRDILSIDRLQLIVGPPEYSWIGANYLAQANFRIIKIDFPAGKKALQYPEMGLLPSFRNHSASDLIFIGLSGFIQLKVGSNSHHWLTAGKILALEPGQKVFFEDRGFEAVKFIILTSQSEGSLATNLHIDHKVLDILTEIQGPIWSRLSWPLLSKSITFENLL